MQRKRDGLVPVAEALAVLPGSAQALQPSTSNQHHFTVADQVNQLAAAAQGGGAVHDASRATRRAAVSGSPPKANTQYEHHARQR